MSIIVYIVPNEKLAELKERQLPDGGYYNPIQDADGCWVISKEEFEFSDIDWVKTLQTKEYKPRLDELI